MIYQAWIVFAFTLTAWFLAPLAGWAQQEPFSTTTRRRLDESTRITNKETGKQIPLREALRLQDANPNSYYLEPIFDEYGQASSYILRPTTAEEKQTGRILTRELSKQPKVGEPMPLFVMEDVDKNTYRSTDLKGRVVILTFLLGLNKSFWDANQSKRIAQLIGPFRDTINPVVLGVTNTSAEKIKDVLKAETLPFVPIPDSGGFHQKFSIMGFTSYIVIDRTGIVAAVVDASEQDRLNEVLEKLK